MSQVQEISAALTSYSAALIGILSDVDWAATLGIALIVARLAQEVPAAVLALRRMFK